MEGETRPQAALGTVRLLLTLGRCVENARDMLTFGRWGGSEKAGGMICRRGVVEKTVGLGK